MHPLQQTSLSEFTNGTWFRQYKLLERIGIGGQGVVWSAIDQAHNRIYAIKFTEVDKSDEATADDIRDEYHLKKLAELQHPNILPIIGFGYEDGLRFIVTPYVPGGTLAERVKSSAMSIEQVLTHGMKIASGLDYLHHMGFIHRDLKSANVFLDMASNDYLADFGLTRQVTTSTLAFHTGHGTPPYAPPEQLQMKAITPQSDIFSFGILLYEMFTGQLPWNGKKQLGMEQTHSDREIPDPREFNENIHPDVVKVLRKATAASPEMRPSTSGMIIQMLQQALSISSTGISTEITDDRDNAKTLLEKGVEYWNASNGTYNLGLTKFALVNLYGDNVTTELQNRFVLSQSLTYGHSDETWWKNVSHLQDRLAVTSILLKKKNEMITARLIGHLKNDLDIRAMPRELIDNMLMDLLEIGTNTENEFFRQEIFEGVRSLARSGTTWKDNPDYLPMIRRLGELAMDDSDSGDMAAELIGRFRFPSAAKIVLDGYDEYRKYAALLTIQQFAGNLPSFIKGGIRTRLFFEWVINRLIVQPVSLISAYTLAFLGAAFGIAIQVYLTYNLPDFLDIARITTSLEQGLIVGAVFGLGIFFTKVINERFRTRSITVPVAIGTIIGGLGMNIALLLFHILFLNTPPRGLLITAGCMLIAFVFSINSHISSKWVKILLSIVSTFTAILGTWWIHSNYASALIELTPMFRYDYQWPISQIAFTALGVSALVGILGNLVNLTITEE